ncbi:MAG: hypothetical protein ACKVTZ_09955 [Bacteroidia bacterium]
MPTLQTPHFSLALPKDWTHQQLSEESWIWQKETDTFILQVQCTDFGNLSKEEIPKVMLTFFSQVELSDGRKMKPVEGTNIPLTDGLAYQYCEGEDIEQQGDFYLVYYGGLRNCTENGHLFSFWVKMVMDMKNLFFGLEQHKTETFDLIEKIVWKTPAPAYQAAQVHPFVQKLGQTKLSFMESYNSGNQGGGYSIEETYFFYENQTFSYRYTYIMSAYSYGGMSLGGGHKDTKKRGQWDISSDGKTLLLYFEDGSTAQKSITLFQGKIQLADRVYFWNKIT